MFRPVGPNCLKLQQFSVVQRFTGNVFYKEVYTVKKSGTSAYAIFNRYYLSIYIIYIVLHILYYAFIYSLKKNHSYMLSSRKQIPIWYFSTSQSASSFTVTL